MTIWNIMTMTMTLTLKKEIEVACRAVTTAAKLCESVRSDILQLQAMTKSDRSPVTISDYGAQAIICKLLKETFPQDQVVAEEDANDLRLPNNKDQLEQIVSYVRRTTATIGSSSASARSSEENEEDILSWIDHGNGSPSLTGEERFWTLDPIDGTKGFLRGDQYAICLALIENGSVTLGVMGCPALELGGQVGHLFIAERGNGAWRTSLLLADDNDDEEQQDSSSSSQFSSLVRMNVLNHQKADTLIQSFEASHGNHLVQQEVAKAVGIETVIKMDSQAKYAMVASGETDLYLRLSNYKENIWDHAAGSILVEEAGGKVSDCNGKPLRYGEEKMTQNNGVVVSNGCILHDKVLATLQNYTIE